MQPCSYGVANITADKEVTLLSRQCIFLGHLSMRINKFIKKEKKNHCALWSHREPIIVLNYMSKRLDVLNSWALRRACVSFTKLLKVFAVGYSLHTSNRGVYILIIWLQGYFQEIFAGCSIVCMLCAK